MGPLNTVEGRRVRLRRKNRTCNRGMQSRDKEKEELATSQST